MKNLDYKLCCTAALVLFSINISVGQQLATGWTTNLTGGYVSPNHMAVIPSTGHRYLMTTLGDDQVNLIHLDQNGNEIWNMPFGGGFHPNTLVYHRGRIFLSGFTGLAGSSEYPAVLRMYEDTGTEPRMVWEYSELIKGQYNGIELMIADPAGDGVIFSCRSSNGDGSTNILKVRRISAAREVVLYDDFNLGASAPGAYPGPKAMCADAAGNAYITGLSDAVLVSSDVYYLNPSTQFILKLNRDGHLGWATPIRERGFNSMGFDINVDATGVYALCQRIPEHLGGPEPIRVALAMLKKLNVSSGVVEESVALPSRRWGSIGRRSILLDRSGIVVAYNSDATSKVTVKAFNTSLVQQWTQDIPLTSGAYFASLISPSEGRIAVGVNNRQLSASALVISSFTRGGTLHDRYESTIGGIAQMQADATGRVHIGGKKAESVGTSGCFAQLLEYRPNYRAFPTDVYATPWLLVELQSQGRLQHWGSFSGTWNCASIPCNAAFTASLAGSNASWKEIMTNPTTISLPQDNKFKTFSFSIQDQAASKLLFEVDRTLIDNGIKSLKIETDWNAATMTVTSTTDGPSIPLTLTLIAKSGKVIGELKTTAPARQVFKDRVAEPVSFIRIAAPPVAPTVSVFPNPSNGNFKVTLDQYANYPLQLAIHDGQGNKVYQQVINSSDTDVTLISLLPGFYILRLTADKFNITKQLQIK